MLYNRRIAGHVIGQLRTSRGMSQEALSGLAGIARTHLTMIENGNKSANVETLWRIASALGIRLSELIFMIEEQTERTPVPPP